MIVIASSLLLALTLNVGPVQAQIVPGDNSTPAPTIEATAQPTEAATPAPTADPTVLPTAIPTIIPTIAPTVDPTSAPTVAPSANSSANPTAAASASGSPAVGGSNTNSTPSASPKSSPTPSPIIAGSTDKKDTVSAKIIKTTKPVLQNIADVAYAAALDTPLSYIMSSEPTILYANHKLSSLSTQILLISGLMSLIGGYTFVKPQILKKITDAFKNYMEIFSQIA